MYKFIHSLKIEIRLFKKIQKWLIICMLRCMWCKIFIYISTYVFSLFKPQFQWPEPRAPSAVDRWCPTFGQRYFLP